MRCKTIGSGKSCRRLAFLELPNDLATYDRMATAASNLFCTTDYAMVLLRLPGISNDLEVVRLLLVL